jgi:beta-N-acetylhexosaminidase
VTVCLLAPLALLSMALLGLGCAPSSVDGPTGTTIPAPKTVTSAPTTIAPTTTTLPPSKQILAGMTLRQKAAQVLLLGFSGTTLTESTSALLQAGPPGGLLLLGYNVSGAGQLRALTAALQEAAASTGPPVGLLIAVDQEGGAVQRIHEGVPDLPSARSLGERSTVAEAERLATETALGLLSLGVNMNLAPVADVVSDRGSFLYDRTFGGDPALVSNYVRGVTKAFETQGLIAVVKHFPGHGSATGNTHGETVASEADKATFQTIHLPPFRAAIAAGAEGVMVSHIIAGAYDPDTPASLSALVVGGLLREELGFTGVVITDDLDMVAAASTSAETGAGPGVLAVAALTAGCDLLISTGTLEQHLVMVDAITAAVQSGKLDLSRLDDAVGRILDLKLRHGILTAPADSAETITP